MRLPLLLYFLLFQTRYLHGSEAESVLIEEAAKLAEDMNRINETLKLHEEIYLLQKYRTQWLCSKYSQQSEHCSATATSVEDLYDWARDAGIYIHENVQITSDPDMGHCLTAKGKLPMNEKVVNVPANSTISTVRIHLDGSEMSRGSTIFKRDSLTCLIGESTPEQPSVASDYWEHTLLALLLLGELRSGDSPLVTYLELLPDKLPSHPLWFTAEHFALLNGSYVYDWSLGTVRAMTIQYAYIYSKLRDNKECAASLHLEDLDLESFRWAFANTISRNYLQSHYPSHDRGIALVPIWDLVNHANHPNVEAVENRVDDPDRISITEGPPWDRFDLVAVRDIEEGEQIFFSYRNELDAAVFLPVWGFVNPECMEVFVHGAPQLFICREDLQSDKMHNTLYRVLNSKHLLKKFDNSTVAILRWYKANIDLKTQQYVRMLDKELLSILDPGTQTVLAELKGERDLMHLFAVKIGELTEEHSRLQ